MPETSVQQTRADRPLWTMHLASADRPLWTAPQLAKKLSIHHLTLLKKVQCRRGKFEIPGGAFKIGKSWRWRDEDVQAFFLAMSGAVAACPPAPLVAPTVNVKRGPGRPRKPAQTGSAA
jgi:hypothetical protein